MSQHSPIVGIDLGTTNSAVAYFDGGQVRVLPNALGEPLTPSVVALDERTGSLVVGRTAKDIYAVHPDLGAALFKRGMGSELDYKIAGSSHTPVELSAMVLRSLRRDATAALKEDVTRCVITVPAYFNEAQRFATMKAGELAGFTVERVINEPTAAAIAHGAHQAHSEGTLLVIDLGGGTFDVCVMDRFEGALEVRSVAGESMLGGEDFTRRVVALGLAKVGVAFEQAEIRDPEGMIRLIKRAELLKRRLSTETEGRLRIPALRNLTETEQEVTLTRPEVEEGFASLVDRLRGPCRGALRSAGLNRTDIDDVVLVGGATRMPCVQALVRSLFQVEPREGVDPDLAIVHGAAIQAALAGEDFAVSDLVVTDVASHSLGVEVTKRLGRRKVDGFFSPIIHRNTVIPTSQAETYSTMDDGQTKIHLSIYEGESRYVRDNRLIGELNVTDIPKGPAGKDVEVRFTFDLNGLLEVEATVVETGKVFQQVFQRNAEALSDEALAAAKERLARLKEDPRDKPFVRDVIARAEALLMEATPKVRERIERMLDTLENALQERDVSAIDQWARELKSLCEQLDGDERW